MNHPRTSSVWFSYPYLPSARQPVFQPIPTHLDIDQLSLGLPLAIFASGTPEFGGTVLRDEFSVCNAGRSG